MAKQVQKIMTLASQVSSLPLVRHFAPNPCEVPDKETLEGYLACQRLAMTAVSEVAAQMTPGWTEHQAADLVGTYLQDHGVSRFFHHPFAWFGERAKFEGFKHYSTFLPTNRVLQKNEVFILDVAPISNGYICDIGYTGCTGSSLEFVKAMKFLREIKEEIPGLFMEHKSGGKIWNIIDDRIKNAGYMNIHKVYPFSVLGHRVYKGVPHGPDLRLLNFGWQSFWSILSRGLFGQLLNANHEGDLKGLWAIEPHIGTSTFGAKFEEILVVDTNRAYWLERSH